MDKKISMAVIRRLPRYYRYLSDLLREGINRVSSKELSKRMGITASQIRQDLNCFGGFGQQGYGYNAELLFKEISKILGIENSFKAIIIGAGNMGHALANYPNFHDRGYDIIGIFDVNPKLIGEKVKEDLKIRNYNEVEEFIKKHKVDVAILTVPYTIARSIAEDMVHCGVKALWNFSPMDIKLTGENVVVENVHLSDSLMVLGYRLNELLKD